MEPIKLDWFSGIGKALAGCCEAQACPAAMKQIFSDAEKLNQPWEPAKNSQYIAFSKPGMHSKAEYDSSPKPSRQREPPSHPLGTLKAPAGPATRKAKPTAISVLEDAPISPPARKSRPPPSPEKAPGGAEDDGEPTTTPKKLATSLSRHWKSNTSSFSAKGKTRSVRRNGMIITRTNTCSSPTARESVLDGYKFRDKGKTRSLR